MYFHEIASSFLLWTFHTNSLCYLLVIRQVNVNGQLASQPVHEIWQTKDTSGIYTYIYQKSLTRIFCFITPEVN